MKKNIKFVQGNEACVEGALYAGLDFFAGYPITPSTEIAEHLSHRLPQQGGKFIQMEDEIAAIGSVIGASCAGVKSMTATSGPGFSLMMENLGLAVCTETSSWLILSGMIMSHPSATNCWPRPFILPAISNGTEPVL